MSNAELVKLFRDLERTRLIECAKIIKQNPDIDIDKLIDDLIPPMKIVVIDDRKATSSIPMDQRCTKVLTSGKNAGNLCSRRRYGSTPYCKIHNKNKAKVKVQLNEISTTPPGIKEYDDTRYIDDNNYIYDLNDGRYTCLGKLISSGDIIDIDDDDKRFLDKECILYY